MLDDKHGNFLFLQMKQRQSNIELLRIFAILNVLMGHGCWLGADMPTSGDFSSHFFQEAVRVITSSATIGSVDVFVLISGWFGIHASRRGLGKFIYQVLFLLWGIYVVALLAGNTVFDLKGIQTAMGIYNGYWFVMAYLGMYILSPVLNAFAENASKRQFEALLLAFYVFQCYYCWGWSMVNYFEGYSIVFFCGLYLTARYVRLYPVKLLYKRPVSIYALSTLTVSVVAYFGLSRIDSPIRMWRYDNPIVILASVCILIAFTKIKFTSKAVNKLAQSCFAVYIIHFNPLVFPYFQKGVMLIAAMFDDISYTIVVLLYFAFVYLVCSVIDWVRQLSWLMIVRVCKLEGNSVKQSINYK